VSNPLKFEKIASSENIEHNSQLHSYEIIGRPVVLELFNSVPNVIEFTMNKGIIHQTQGHLGPPNVDSVPLHTLGLNLTDPTFVYAVVLLVSVTICIFPTDVMPLGDI
jgi:hypothetical protein